MKNRCETLHNLLDRYADGERLPHRVLRALRDHLDRCPGCRARLARHDAIVRAVLEAGTACCLRAAPGASRLDRVRRVWGAIEEEARREKSAAGLSARISGFTRAAAAAVLVTGILHLLVFSGVTSDPAGEGSPVKLGAFATPGPGTGGAPAEKSEIEEDLFSALWVPADMPDLDTAPPGGTALLVRVTPRGVNGEARVAGSARIIEVTVRPLGMLPRGLSLALLPEDCEPPVAPNRPAGAKGERGTGMFWIEPRSLFEASLSICLGHRDGSAGRKRSTYRIVPVCLDSALEMVAWTPDSRTNARRMLAAWSDTLRGGRPGAMPTFESVAAPLPLALELR